ncbi:MAG: hypothetical protein LUD14_05815 [Clostridiales bacterium]|nr:hypothetical protein [Clostridiales bacterium]
MFIHHKLDIYLEPERVLYINEVAIADNAEDQTSYDEEQHHSWHANIHNAF